MNGDSVTPLSDSTFETSLVALEAIVNDLEDGQLGLADALARYEQGVKHLKHCYELLTAAEQKIELLTGVAEDGLPTTQPFDDADEPLAESAGRRRRAKPARPSANAQSREGGGDIDG